MLFALKKFLATLLMPLSLGFILFFISLIYLFTNKIGKAKFYFFITFVWFFAIGYAPFSNAIIQPLENQYHSYLKVDKSLKYVLVLGSGHHNNESMSAVASLSNTALRRLSEGIRIYNKLDDAKLMVSGYKSRNDTTSHAYISKKAAVSLGINPDNIITQDEAKDTIEEAITTKKIVGDNKLILVTSAAHMPRAMQIFKAAKIDVVAAPTDFLSKDDGKYLSMPGVKELKKTQSAFHEYLGILWYRILNFI